MLLARSRRTGGSLLAAAAIVSASAFAAAPSPARAAACWERVIVDWRDGRITGTYSVACLRQAIAHLPEDLRVYGTAEVDIERALTRALAASNPARRFARSRLGTTADATQPTTSEPGQRARSLQRRPRATEHAAAAPAAPTAAPTASAGSFPTRAVIVAAVMAAVGVAFVVWLWRDRRRASPRRP
jgi:hypothetical protein